MSVVSVVLDKLRGIKHLTIWNAITLYFHGRGNVFGNCDFIRDRRESSRLVEARVSKGKRLNHLPTRTQLPVCVFIPVLLISCIFFFLCDVIPFLTVKVNLVFLCLTALKAATCRAKVTAGTPRHWPRQFRSTMIPSTPCTSPELASTSASPPADSLSFCLFISYLPVSLSSSPTSLFPCSLSLSLHTHSTFFWICTKAVLGRGNLLCPDVQQVFVSRNNLQPAFPIEPPFKPAIQHWEPRGFPMHKRKKNGKKTKTNHTHTYYKLSHYFEFVFSIWMSALLCL